MAWALVILAGLFETGFALSLKASSGFTRPVPTVLFVVCAAASFTLLATALRSLPIGSAYAVWTGIGAARTAAAGVVVLGEEPEVLKQVSVVWAVGGGVRLRLASSGRWRGRRRRGSLGRRGTAAKCAHRGRSRTAPRAGAGRVEPRGGGRP